MKTEELKQLADALVADTLQCENPTELYHSLERLYKGARAIEALTNAALNIAQYEELPK